MSKTLFWLMAYIVDLTFAVSIFTIPISAAVVYAEQVITILPGANNKDSPAFFDVTFYPIQIGKELRWYNDDEVSHKIIISGGEEENNKTKLFDSGNIKPKASFSYKFDKSGSYHFSSPIYPWMQGTVFVSDDISTRAMTTNLKNNVAIQLTWSPSKPKVGEETHFVITFINEKTNRNQEHIDYQFIIYDQNSKRVFQQGLHSGWGVEQGTYKFTTAGNYIAEVTIYYILFAPVQPDIAKYNIGTAAK
jgi:plastocyanin